MNPLFLVLFDDAAIFPPGNVPMSEAVMAYRARLDSPLAPMLGPFVCSLARLDELVAVVAGGPVLRTSLVLPEAGADVSAVQAASTGIDVVSTEGPALPGGGGTRRAYQEVPLGEISATRVAALRDARSRLKIRTGGVRAEAFPTEKDLAGALWSAVRGGVAFKLTAGLHDPIRHRDPMTGFEHHGFLNVIVATAHAVQGGDVGEIAAALADQDGHRVAAAIATIDSGLARQVRSRFVSFGTCSVDEPVYGLLDLGLLPEDLRELA
ncbi:hypothetical protein ACQP2E_16280 [Actinoplanes sp. CA-015351]|uniref:hypothetical protein n=1 Tax=Actinoplanes sp. CA-015351 TaxID=3239897 RepID=UPI003D962FD7